MSRSLTALVAALAVGLLLMPAVGADEQETVYTAPYAEGTEGGDSFSLVYADADDGMVFVGRANPVFNPISCGPGGGWGKFEVVHDLADGPITEVTADVSPAAVDPYTFVTLAVRTEDGEWLASTRERGPIVLSTSLTAEVFDEIPEEVESVVIEFGLEVASACPHANGGLATFSQITVR